MNEFPKMLYHDTDPGEGTVFAGAVNYKVVSDEEEQESAIDDGWRFSPLGPQPIDAEPAHDGLAEAKAQAKARGIKLTGKGLETLLREIAEHDASR